jgi:hypothetical protein
MMSLTVEANEITNQPADYRWDQPAIPTSAIPTLLPSVTLGLGQACVGIAGVRIAVCTHLRFPLVEMTLKAKLLTGLLNVEQWKLMVLIKRRGK